MLKRVKIQGYKSLVDVELELQPLTVLFGPNAAGKSNFLDALQLLSRLATSANLRDAFAPPYRGTTLESFTFGPKGIAGLLEQKRAQFSIEIDIEPSQRAIKTVEQDLLQWPEHERDLREAIESRARTPLFPPIPEDVKTLKYGVDVEIQPRTGILTARQEIKTFDAEGAIKDRLLAERQITSGLLEDSYNLLFGAHASYAVVLREELTSWLFFYLEPRERMRLPASVKEVRHIGMMGEDIGPFLNTLRAIDENQFKALEKALHLLIPEITGIDVEVNNRGEIEVQLMQGETPLPASVLSEGTWRILGLLALGGAKEAPALLGFEEPENGINPQRLDLIASLLTNLTYNDTQVIVTTHSPTLLDMLPRESLYLVHQVEGKTSIDPLARFETKDTDGKNRLVSERLLRGDFNA